MKKDQKVQNLGLEKILKLAKNKRMQTDCARSEAGKKLLSIPIRVKGHKETKT